MQKYSVNQYVIEAILASIKSDEIAIPEIQRPFVLDSSKVRDLMDSLYQGYPVGYIIAWKNPNVKLNCSHYPKFLTVKIKFNKEKINFIKGKWS